MLATVSEAIAGLTRTLGLRGDLQLRPCRSGGNHRVWRCDIDGQSLLAKLYHQPADDPRDRLRAEFDFSQYAWHAGVRAIAEPLIADRANQLALYRWIDGDPIRAGDIDERAIDAAADFVVAINRARDYDTARALPLAAEACFRRADHLALIDERVARLSQIGNAAEVDRAARALVHGRLTAAWREVSSSTERADPTAVVRCLSPSDFGFHNAMSVHATSDTARGWVFFDFEYAGWDDPAKLVADFFLQVAVPVPERWRTRFTHRLQASMYVDADFDRRAQQLAAAYRIKWCCIALNPFLPAGERRQGSLVTASGLPALKWRRLQIVEELLDGLC